MSDLGLLQQNKRGVLFKLYIKHSKERKLRPKYTVVDRNVPMGESKQKTSIAFR